MAFFIVFTNKPHDYKNKQILINHWAESIPLHYLISFTQLTAMSTGDHRGEYGGIRPSESRSGLEMPARRRLFDPSLVNPHQALDLEAEGRSVRDQAASLSSRAVLEGLNSDGSDEEEESTAAIEESIDEIYSDEVPVPYTPPAQEPYSEVSSLLPQRTASPESKPQRHSFAVKIFGYLPSVAIGLLLNILDGLSYGMILFPIGTKMFNNMESVGLALFYVSTIVSQLVYSLGGSHFKACVGSEMIEIVPFFHAIALKISGSIGPEYGKEHVLSTTITAFAFFSIITGMVFFALGYLRLGALVGFFPRHILVGCIGGVGWFLTATGLEVAARLPNSLEYNLVNLKYLLQPETLARWTSCLALGLILMWAERRFPHPLVVPGTLIATFFIFHIIVAISALDLDMLRRWGWCFPAQPSGEPWYYFYELYKPSQIHFREILETIPEMLALTFFGIIHVPINVPAFAAATKMDDVNVNRELVAHGVSNTLSGLIGSIQNYLVYTNSVLFVKSGADSATAGVLLAIATFLVMIAGPVVIGYIPVIVVASLIFMMGIDLMFEALVDTWTTLDRKEYFTVVAIVVIMGGYDFVIGILAGIILACLFFVITSARNDPIKATFTGDTAHSTVRRHPLLQRFLAKVGTQIYVMKLQGALFFGTNVRIERSVRELLASDWPHPIKYLIVDLNSVTDIDFCSADTFARLKRLLDASRVQLILSGAHQSATKVRGLRAVDLITDGDGSVKVFPSLNTALEWCENQFLQNFYRHRDSVSTRRRIGHNIGEPRHGSTTSSFSVSGVTPRTTTLRDAVVNSADEERRAGIKWRRFQQPFALIIQTVSGISDRDEDFWFRVSKYFHRRDLLAGTVISDSQFVLIETGSLNVQYHSGFYETVLAGTAWGELSLFGKISSGAKVSVESPSVLWTLTQSSYREMLNAEDGSDLALGLQSVAFHIATERFAALTQFIEVAAA